MIKDTMAKLANMTIDEYYHNMLELKMDVLATLLDNEEAVYRYELKSSRLNKSHTIESYHKEVR